MWNALNGELNIWSLGIGFPIGFPIVLEGRQITQMLCLSQLAWDDPADEGIQQKWIKWKLSLKKLQEMKLSWCYKQKGFGKVVSCILHYFSDASERGYGKATYLRLVNTAGKVHWSLVIAKSWVVLLEYTSIPRWKLAAAVFSTKMSWLIKELGFDDIGEY